MKLSVFGLGYVGCVSAACFASAGHEVVGVDVNQVKVDIINSGRSPIVEPGVEQLIDEAASAGRLRPATTVRIHWYNRQGDDSPLLRHIFGLEGRKFGERLSRSDEPVAWQDVTIDAIDASPAPSGTRQVLLKEPLSHDVKPEWQAEIVSVARLSDVGIEHLVVEFPDVPYAGHHLER